MRDNPCDGDLSQALKNLSARKTMDQGGYGALEDGEGSFRDILQEQGRGRFAGTGKARAKTEDVTERLIGEYEARLQTEPDNLKIMRSLAELYTQKKAVRQGAGNLRAHQKFRHGQRPVARSAPSPTPWSNGSTIRSRN